MITVGISYCHHTTDATTFEKFSCCGENMRNIKYHKTYILATFLNVEWLFPVLRCVCQIALKIKKIIKLTHFTKVFVEIVLY